MTDASRPTRTPTGSHGTATIAGTTGRGGINRLPSLTIEAEQALIDRGLDIELCVRLGLTSAVAHGTDDWIAIPTMRGDRPVRWKYRRVEKVEGQPNFLQDAGGEQCVWNVDALSDTTLRDERLIITEGEFDAIIAMQCGFARVVSLPNGSTIPTGPHSSAWIDELLDAVDAKDEIVLACDDDEPGLKARADLEIRLGAGRCRFITYPVGFKDLNDAFRAYRERGVTECFARARWCRVSGVFTMSELPPLPTQEALATGISGLGEHYRVRRGDFCVITGVPGHGKSTFVNDLACRMVERHGWTIGFASFEQSPALDHKRALRRWYGQKPPHMQSEKELADADDWIERSFAFIHPEDDDDANLDYVMERSATLIKRYGCQMIVIDPWNEIEHDRPKDMTTTEYVNWAIRRFKRFAHKWNVHLIIVAHPTKLQRQNDGKVPMPTMYDISDSAAWANKADLGIVVYKDGSQTTIRVAKSRYHEEIGKPGEALLTYSEHTGHFC